MQARSEVLAQVAGGATHQIEARLGASSRNALRTLQAGHTVAVTGLAVVGLAPAAESGASMAAPACTCTWAEASWPVTPLCEQAVHDLTSRPPRQWAGLPVLRRIQVDVACVGCVLAVSKAWIGLLIPARRWGSQDAWISDGGDIEQSGVRLVRQAHGALLVSLSALPALLTSPLFQAQLTPLSCLQAAGGSSAAACAMSAVCRATLAEQPAASVRQAAVPHIRAWPACLNQPVESCLSAA